MNSLYNNQGIGLAKKQSGKIGSDKKKDFMWRVARGNKIRIDVVMVL